MSMNSVMLIGHLAFDGELTFTPNGKSKARTKIVVDNGYKDRQTGEWKENPSFIPLSAWGAAAERMGQLKKGERIYVAGKMHIDDYEDKDGNRRTFAHVNCYIIERTSMVKLQDNPQQAPQEQAPKPPMPDFDDDIPF